MPLGICLSRAGSLLLLLLLREVGARELALLLQTPFSRFSWSVDSPQFSPHVPRRENSRESSVSCSRVLSFRESRSSERGSRVDKRARSREVSSRGRHSRSRSSYRSRLSGRERGRRSSSASRFSRGRSRCERSRSSDRYRSRRGSSRSRRAWSRSSDRYRSRRDRSRRGRSRSFGRYRSRRERARSHACRGVRRGRSRWLACPLAVKRAITCFSCPLAGRGSRTAGQTWAPGGCGGICLSASCGLEQRRAFPPVLEGRPLPLSRLFLQELAKFFMGLSGSSSLGAPGVLAGVTASAAASGGVACPSSTAAGAATFLCCDCDACWGWRFCLLLPLLVLACLVTSGVRACPALAGVAVGRLVMGPMDVLRALQRRVSFFCWLFASSGEALSLFHRFV